MFNSKSKYLFLLPIVLMIAFSVFFHILLDEIGNALLHEKMIEKRLNIDLIDSQIDRFIELDDDWGTYDYESILAYDMNTLDKLPLTFAALYDENLNNLSVRAPSYESAPFDPMIYEEFLQAIYENERGDIKVLFAPPDSEERDMLIYFRWVPSDASLNNRLLTVVAISRYSVDTPLSGWIVYGTATLIFVTTLLNLVLVALLCNLGNVYSKRKGRVKWRQWE
jgi:hypothetical protein